MFKLFFIIGVTGIIISGIFIGAWTMGNNKGLIFIPKQKTIEISEQK